MSYSGFTERLCTRGHYSATDVWCDQPTKCKCGEPFRYFHGVDQTNGYDESEPYSCRAPKAQVGTEDEWHMDPYLNRYARVIPLFAPEGDEIWIQVNSKGQSTCSYPDDLASVDTLPKGQDAKQGLAGTEGSAVGEAETPKGEGQ